MLDMIVTFRNAFGRIDFGLIVDVVPEYKSMILLVSSPARQIVVHEENIIRIEKNGD